MNNPENSLLKSIAMIKKEPDIDPNGTSDNLSGKAIDYAFSVVPKQEINIKEEEEVTCLQGEIIETELEIEEIHNSATTEVFSCNECKFQTNLKAYLKTHINYMHGDFNNYTKCKHCVGYWPDKNHVLHQKMRHLCRREINQQHPYTCKECKLKIFDTGKLYAHLKIHGDISGYCILCAFSTDKSEELIEHMQNEHQVHKDSFQYGKCMPHEDYKYHEKYSEICNKRISLGNPYTCYDCNKVLTDTEHISEHIKLSCIDNNYLKNLERHYCDGCNSFLPYTKHHLHKEYIRILKLEINNNTPYICEECDTSFDTIEAAVEHLNEHDNDSDINFFCDVCKEYFPYRSHKLHYLYIDLISEILKVNKENPYVCKDCNKTFVVLQNVIEHLKLHDPEPSSRTKKKSHEIEEESTNRLHVGQLKCHECEFTTNYYLALRKHKDEAHFKVEYKCTRCNAFWPDKNHILHQKMKYVKDILKKSDSYSCKECKVDLVDTDEIYEHLKIHGNLGHFCEYCVFRCDTYSDLDMHNQNEHKDDITLNNTEHNRQIIHGEMDSNVFCDECNLYWPDDDHKAHKTMLNLTDIGVSEAKPYICLFCQKAITDLKKVYFHLTRFCKKVYCEMCPFYSDSYTSVYRHKQNMHMVRKKDHSCELCDYKGYNKEDLLQHQKIHQDENEIIYYPCDECSFKTKNYTYLAKHKQRVHSKEYQNAFFTCNICGYTTYDKIYMAKHKRRHVHKNDSDQVYVCKYCSYETPTKAYMEKHKNRVHTKITKDPTYICQICAKEYSFKMSLTFHMRKVHNQGEPKRIYKCYHCNYEHAARETFKRHVFKHLEKKQMMYCANCDYKTANKTNLIQHMVKHRDPSKMKMYKCKICKFVTKRAHTLRHHVKSHSVC